MSLKVEHQWLHCEICEQFLSSSWRESFNLHQIHLRQWNPHCVTVLNVSCREKNKCLRKFYWNCFRVLFWDRARTLFALESNWTPSTGHGRSGYLDRNPGSIHVSSDEFGHCRCPRPDFLAPVLEKPGSCTLHFSPWQSRHTQHAHIELANSICFRCVIAGSLTNVFFHQLICRALDGQEDHITCRAKRPMTDLATHWLFCCCITPDWPERHNESPATPDALLLYVQDCFPSSPYTYRVSWAMPLGSQNHLHWAAVSPSVDNVLQFTQWFTAQFTSWFTVHGLFLRLPLSCAGFHFICLTLSLVWRWGDTSSPAPVW